MAATSYRRKLYNAYSHAKDRCYNPRNRSYVYYGGRGITMDADWLLPNGAGFVNFMTDMGEPADTSDFSLDRIDPDGHYAADNCRWVKWSDQSKNKRNNHIVEFQHKQMTVKEAASMMGVNHQTLYERIRRGLTAQAAVDLSARRIAP